ncbi:A/G-specific adenine glycosylase [Altererythrobacter sp. TH136]|uniref:A/G-specific adenine glycosylase n=1 Tax=Altererythrobacter sp. TH136 TaxID=2067415 RepID=UPI0011635285|nr:A/G-specific adenine glycosylase [Altererythrobacter sp. TH136]QDM40236.1 A/G-specific adenine glycosylase [Altererythrobacter sp. TH136]
MTASEDSVASALLAWYDRHARTLPWRSPPGAPPPDAYRVWLSEVMLQQTTTAAVAPYYRRFLERWPTVADLGAADEPDVMAAWAGLGYYSRARNLIAAARAVVERGGFPDNEAGLRALPGVGAYIAAAVAAIAFEQRAVVVDANVERVVSRLFAIADPLPQARKAIRVRTDEITPDQRAGDFAQAMMDLGATICTPRQPRCLVCPVAGWCDARAEGEPERYPVKAAKKTKPMRTGSAFWIERDGHVWLIRREGRGMLGGMRALPGDGWSAAIDGSGDAPIAAEWTCVGTVRHGFTHFDLELTIRRASATQAPAVNGEWWPIDRLGEAGLPTLFAKAAARVLG